jgi:hypothetical protein
MARLNKPVDGVYLRVMAIVRIAMSEGAVKGCMPLPWLAATIVLKPL